MKSQFIKSHPFPCYNSSRNEALVTPLGICTLKTEYEAHSFRYECVTGSYSSGICRDNRKVQRTAGL